jgi:hypothetical protein
MAAVRSAGRGVSNAAAIPAAFITGVAEQHRHNRANGISATATLRQRLRPAPYNPAAPPPGGNGSAPEPAGAQAAPPAPSQPPQQPSSNGGTVASTTGAEQLIEGVNRIHAEAAAGGIHHKQAALKAAAEGSIRFSAMAQMLARTMSEPGNNYGPEITEPLAKAAQHLQAAAMSFGEADTNVTSMIHMSVGDLARSSRQAPHHSELSENGSK